MTRATEFQNNVAKTIRLEEMFFYKASKIFYPRKNVLEAERWHADSASLIENAQETAGKRGQLDRLRFLVRSLRLVHALDCCLFRVTRVGLQMLRCPSSYKSLVSSSRPSRNSRGRKREKERERERLELS